MEFKESLKKNIIEILRCSDEKSEEVASFLVDEQGVESFEDLSLLNEEDLSSVLKTVQRRKFLLAWTSQSKNHFIVLH